MGMATAFFVLGAFVFIRTGFLHAVRKLVMERVEEDLDEGVCVVAI